VPADLLARDWSRCRTSATRAAPGVRAIYETHPDEHWEAYDLCEKLVDVEEYFQLWRFRHMKTVERVIGFRAAPAVRRAWASCAKRST
jgi:tryptophan 2,3-dioxygenase